MKASYYNTYIESNEYCLYYNAFTDSYLLLNTERNNYFEENRNNLPKIKQKYPLFYKKLLKNGFIIGDNIDEKNIILFERLKSRFSNSTYKLIINPTLSCNLSCWYCYETHRTHSKMSGTISDSIIRHLDRKIRCEPFSKLIIIFFGGEPLMYSDEVVISLIKKIYNNIIKKHKILLEIGFTTNGTVIHKNLLNFLKEYDIHTNFQITIDGHKKYHNKIRGNAQFDSYKTIQNNISNIFRTLLPTRFHVSLRINFSNQTLKQIPHIIQDFSFMDKKFSSFTLVKIWQIKKETIEPNNLIFALNHILDRGYIANFNELNIPSLSCYADIYNGLVINYDGYIFKCTARDFLLEDRVGKLLSDGNIKYNTSKIAQRLSVQLPKICKNCKLLPSCPGGICSQKLIENRGDDDRLQCPNKNNILDFSDYMFYNFKRNVLLERLTDEKIRT